MVTIGKVSVDEFSNELVWSFNDDELRDDAFCLIGDLAREVCVDF